MYLVGISYKLEMLFIAPKLLINQNIYIILKMLLNNIKLLHSCTHYGGYIINIYTSASNKF